MIFAMLVNSDSRIYLKKPNDSQQTEACDLKKLKIEAWIPPRRGSKKLHQHKAQPELHYFVFFYKVGRYFAPVVFEQINPSFNKTG